MNEPSQRIDVNRDTALHNFDRLNLEGKEAVLAEGVSQLSPESKKAVLVEGVSQLSPESKKAVLVEGVSQLSPESKEAVLVEGVSQLSSESKKAVIAESANQLSPQDRQEIMQAGLRRAGQQVSDQVWLIIAYSFAIVLVGTFLSIAISIAISFLRKPEATAELQILLTMFTSAVGFLAGLFVPSPSHSNRSLS